MIKQSRQVVFAMVFTALFVGAWTGRADLNSGLVAYYPLDGNANDVSGNGHNGTPIGVAWGPGRVVQAAQFNNGNRAHIETGSLLQPPQFTIAAWVNVAGIISDPNNHFEHIVSTAIRRSPYANRGYCFQWAADVNKLWFFTGKDGEEDNNLQYGPISYGVWYHLVGTLSNGAKSFYVNGQLVDHAATDYSASSANLGIGCITNVFNQLTSCKANG